MNHQRGQTGADGRAAQGEDVYRALRAWARGGYSDEAAVELIIRAFNGRFAYPDWPWIKRLSHGGYWLDGESITTKTGALSSGEQRILAVVASLAGYRALARSIASVMNCDRTHQELILAAISHTGGTHEHTELQIVPDGGTEFVKLGALVRWPIDSERDNVLAAEQPTLLSASAAALTADQDSHVDQRN